MTYKNETQKNKIIIKKFLQLPVLPSTLVTGFICLPARDWRIVEVINPTPSLVVINGTFQKTETTPLGSVQKEMLPPSATLWD